MTASDLSTGFQILLILLVTIPCFTVMSVYDHIGALGPILQEAGILDLQSFGYVYVTYSIFAPFCVLGAGIMADKLGQKTTTIIVLVPMLAGSIIVWLCYETYGLFLFGRLLSGFGEALLVLQQRLVGTLFTGNLLSFGFTMTNVLGQLGNAFVFFFSPILGKSNLFLAMGLGVILVLLAVVCCIIYFILDGMYKLESKNVSTVESPMKLSDIKEFPFSYWCINLIHAFSTCSLFVMMSFGPSFLVDEAGYDPETAGLIVAIMNLMILIAPISSWGIDQIGHRTKFWGICSVIIDVSFVLLALNLTDPIYWLLLLAFAFNILNSSIGAAVPLIIKESNLGTAYGLIGLSFTLGLLVYPFIISSLRTWTGSWFSCHLFFAATNFISILCVVGIEMTDRKAGIFSRPYSHAGYEVIE